MRANGVGIGVEVIMARHKLTGIVFKATPVYAPPARTHGAGVPKALSLGFSARGTRLVNFHPLTSGRYAREARTMGSMAVPPASVRRRAQPVGVDALPLGTCGTLMK